MPVFHFKTNCFWVILLRSVAYDIRVYARFHWVSNCSWCLRASRTRISLRTIIILHNIYYAHGCVAYATRWISWANRMNTRGAIRERTQNCIDNPKDRGGVPAPPAFSPAVSQSDDTPGSRSQIKLCSSCYSVDTTLEIWAGRDNVRRSRSYVCKR